MFWKPIGKENESKCVTTHVYMSKAAQEKQSLQQNLHYVTHFVLQQNILLTFIRKTYSKCLVYQILTEHKLCLRWSCWSSEGFLSHCQREHLARTVNTLLWEDQYLLLPSVQLRLEGVQSLSKMLHIFSWLTFQLYLANYISVLCVSSFFEVCPLLAAYSFMSSIFMFPHNMSDCLSIHHILEDAISNTLWEFCNIYTNLHLDLRVKWCNKNICRY